MPQFVCLCLGHRLSGNPFLYIEAPCHVKMELFRNTFTRDPFAYETPYSGGAEIVKSTSG